MWKYTYVLLFIPLLTFCRSAAQQTPSDEAAIYAQAVKDYILAAESRNNIAFDTLFIAKRKNGQPDDFPDITLPEIIQNTHIILIEPERYEKRVKTNKTGNYLNMMGWVNEKKAEFVFVLFKNGFVPAFTCSSEYSYNKKEKRFLMKKLEFK